MMNEVKKRCDECGSSMLMVYGCGWDYDCLMCGECDYTYWLTSNTYPPFHPDTEHWQNMQAALEAAQRSLNDARCIISRQLYHVWHADCAEALAQIDASKPTKKEVQS